MNALAYALQLLQALPALIQAGQDAADLVARVKEMHDQGRDPSPGEWDDLNARIATLRGDLHADDITGTDAG
jgi:hypothetical protein